MNIFELFGMIAVNNKGANQAIDQTGKKANTLASTMGKAFDKVGKMAIDCGKTVAKGLAVGTAAMTGMVVKSVNLAGDLEQNMGGAEAVFKNFAEKMKKTAADAYKSMGLSQSEYLATANKMGALFQGVGYTIEDSASITEKAMQRAADVASIMGIDVSTAMESIAGAAKGNFTMMDNLGVAVNDTAIANYALEKGIKKSTAQMSTQEKVALAMELFMEKTAYAAGNYAKENDTLAGSLTTAKAAFQNFLSGAGDADALSDALVNSADVISKNLNKLLPKLVSGLNKLMKKLIPKLPELIRTTLPGIIEGAGELLTGLAMALPDMIGVVIDVLPETMKKLGYAFDKAWNRGVWPWLQKLFKVAFDIELPKWHKFKLDFRLWWDAHVKPVLSNIKKWWDEDGKGIWDNLVAFGKDVGGAFKTAFEWILDNHQAVITALEGIAAVMVGKNILALLSFLGIGAGAKGAAVAAGAAGASGAGAAAAGAGAGAAATGAAATGALALAGVGSYFAARTVGNYMWPKLKKSGYEKATAEEKEMRDLLDKYGLEFLTVLDGKTYSLGESMYKNADGMPTFWAPFSYETKLRKQLIEGLNEGYSSGDLAQVELYAILNNAFIQAWKEGLRGKELLSDINAAAKDANAEAQKYFNENPLVQPVTLSYTNTPKGATMPGFGAPSRGEFSNDAKLSLHSIAGHANGLDFVPYDNYLARLHYGETVLTRKDADAWRKGSTGNMAMLSAKFDQMQETFIQVLEGIRNQPIAINIDSKAAAVLMAKEMTKSIGNRNIQALMGMGG